MSAWVHRDYSSGLICTAYSLFVSVKGVVAGSCSFSLCRAHRTIYSAAGSVLLFDDRQSAIFNVPVRRRAGRLGEGATTAGINWFHWVEWIKKNEHKRRIFCVGRESKPLNLSDHNYFKPAHLINFSTTSYQTICFHRRFWWMICISDVIMNWMILPGTCRRALVGGFSLAAGVPSIVSWRLKKNRKRISALVSLLCTPRRWRRRSGFRFRRHSRRHTTAGPRSPVPDTAEL